MQTRKDRLIRAMLNPFSCFPSSSDVCTSGGGSRGDPNLSFFLSRPRPHALQTSRAEKGKLWLSRPQLRICRSPSVIILFIAGVFGGTLTLKGFGAETLLHSYEQKRKKKKKKFCATFVKAPRSTASFDCSFLFFYLYLSGRGDFVDFFSITSFRGSLQTEECCPSSLPWPVVSAASVSPLSQPMFWKPR